MILSHHSIQFHVERIQTRLRRVYTHAPPYQIVMQFLQRNQTHQNLHSKSHHQNQEYSKGDPSRHIRKFGWIGTNNHRPLHQGCLPHFDRTVYSNSYALRQSLVARGEDQGGQAAFVVMQLAGAEEAVPDGTTVVKPKAIRINNKLLGFMAAP